MTHPSIWTTGDEIHLSIPSPEPGARAHVVVMPNNEKGWAVIATLLRDREHSEQQPYLGTRAAPVQYDIDKMLLHIQKIPPVRKVEAPAGLSLEELDL